MIELISINDVVNKFYKLSSPIYIYGAGLYGYCLYNELKKNNISVRGFIVSDKHKRLNAQEICNKKIYSLSEMQKKEGNRDFVLIVALSDNNQKEVVQGLQKVILKRNLVLIKDDIYIQQMSDIMQKDQRWLMHQTILLLSNTYKPNMNIDAAKEEKLLKQFDIFKVALLHSDPFGLFCLEYHLYYNARLIDESPRTCYIMPLVYLEKTKPVNMALYKMIKNDSLVKKEIIIVDSDNIDFWYSFLKKYRNLIEVISWGYSNEWTMEIRRRYFKTGHLEWLDYKPCLTINDSYKKEKINMFTKLAINQPYICIAIRDKAYYDECESDLNYYRNSDIHSFDSMVDYFYTLGIKMVRMGAKVSTKYKRNGVVDYAMNYRSELGDILLFSECECAVLDTSGILLLPSMFRKHIAIINVYTPILYNEIGVPFEIYIPMTYCDRKTKAKLSLRQLLKITRDVSFQKPKSNGYFAFMEYILNKGYEIIYNNGEEILEVSKEIYLLSKGEYSYSKDDDSLQNEYRQIIYEFSKPYNELQGLGRIGMDWLRKNKWYLE